MIAVIPRDGVKQEDALADVQRVMRSRHGLKLDEPNDFDIGTQDAILKVWDRISSGIFLALVVIYVAIMAAKLSRISREISELAELAARRDEQREADREAVPR